MQKWEGRAQRGSCGAERRFLELRLLVLMQVLNVGRAGQRGCRPPGPPCNGGRWSCHCEMQRLKLYPRRGFSRPLQAHELVPQGAGDPRKQSRPEGWARTQPLRGDLQTQNMGPLKSQVQAGNRKSVVFQTPVGKFEKYTWKHDSLPPPQGSPFLVSVIFLPRANSNHIPPETTRNEGGQSAAEGGTEAPREGPEMEQCAELATQGLSDCPL